MDAGDQYKQNLIAAVLKEPEDLFDQVEHVAVAHERLCRINTQLQEKSNDRGLLYQQIYETGYICCHASPDGPFHYPMEDQLVLAKRDIALKVMNDLAVNFKQREINYTMHILLPGEDTKENKQKVFDTMKAWEFAKNKEMASRKFAAMNEDDREAYRYSRPIFQAATSILASCVLDKCMAFFANDLGDEQFKTKIGLLSTLGIASDLSASLTLS